MQLFKIQEFGSFFDKHKQKGTTMTAMYETVSLAGIRSNLEHARERRSQALNELVNAVLEVERLEEAIVNIAGLSIESGGHETRRFRLEDVAMGDRYPTFDPDYLDTPDLSISKETAGILLHVLGPMEWRPPSVAYVKEYLAKEGISGDSEGFHSSLITVALADPDCGSFPAGWESVSSGGFSGSGSSLTARGLTGGDELAIKWAQNGAV